MTLMTRARPLLLALLLLALGQAPAAASESVPVAEVRAQLAALEANPSPSEAQVAEIAALRQALAFVDQAEQARRAADEMAALADQAPDRLAALEAELSEPLPPVPELPRGLSLEDLVARQEAARSALEQARVARDAVEAEAERRPRRRAEVPEEVGALNQRSLEIDEVLTAMAAADDASGLSRARRWALQAERDAATMRIAQLDQEIRSYDVRRGLLRVRRQQAERRMLAAQREYDAWATRVAVERATMATLVRRQARQELEAVAGRPPVLRAVAEENAALALELGDIADRSRDLADEARRVAALRERWTKELESTRARVDRAGLSGALGLLLRKQRAELPPVREHERGMRRLRQEMKRVQLRRLELEAAAITLVDAEGEAGRRLEVTALPARVPADLKLELTEALRRQRDGYVTPLSRALDAYFEGGLVEVYETRGALVELLREFAAFIDQRVLWVQSNRPLGLADFSRLGGAARWLAAPEHWWAVARALAREVSGSSLAWLTIMGVSLVLLVLRRHLRVRLEEQGRRVARSRREPFATTLAACGVTVLLAAGLPLLLLALSWRTGRLVEGQPFASAVAAGLREAALLLFALDLSRLTCSPGGLGAVHFRWGEAALTELRSGLRWLTPIVVAGSFLVGTTAAQPNEAHVSSLGRLALMVVAGAVTLFVWRILHPRRGVLAGVLARRRGGWLDRLRPVWFAVLVSAPPSLAVAAGLGYVYTATQLARRLLATLLVIGLGVTVHAVLVRWLQVEHGRLAREQARLRRAAGPAEAQSVPEDSIPAPDAELDLDAIGEQTRRVLGRGAAVAVLFGLFLVWANVLPALGILDEVTLWTRVVEVTPTTLGPEVGAVERQLRPTTLNDLGIALLIVVVTVALGRNLPGLMELLLQRLPFTAGARNALTAISQYVMVAVGIVAAAAVLGLSWSKVQWLVAAMTVGLGFGLQEIFANFISGLIILLERPIRVGDVVTLGGVHGKVSRIRIRATTIVDWDRRELIVPNKEFITGQLVNWSLSDPITRLVIPVGVAYGSDTARAKELLLECARACPSVLAEPAPTAIFRSFDESSLLLNLRAYMPSLDVWPAVIDELHERIDAAFREAGIEIAFPQRDLHVRSIDAPIAVRAEGAPKGPPSERRRGR